MCYASQLDTGNAMRRQGELFGNRTIVTLHAPRRLIWSAAMNTGDRERPRTHALLGRSVARRAIGLGGAVLQQLSMLPRQWSGRYRHVTPIGAEQNQQDTDAKQRARRHESAANSP